MSQGSTTRWSAFGIAGIFSIALLNSSCCSHRKAVNESRTETTEQVNTTAREEVRSEKQNEVSQTTETEHRGVTTTEIKIFDTTREPDPETGELPVKAWVKQTHGDESTSREKVDATTSDVTDNKSQMAQTYEGGTLDEVTVTAELTPSLWERMKQGAAWATAIMILAAAGWIIYKIKKRKTT